MWGRWAPPLERSKLVSVGYMGKYNLYLLTKFCELAIVNII